MLQQCCLLRRTWVLMVLARVHRLQHWHEWQGAAVRALPDSNRGKLAAHSDICGRKSCLIENYIQHFSKSVWHFLSAPARETSPFYRCWKWTKDQAAAPEHKCVDVRHWKTINDWLMCLIVNHWLSASSFKITYRFSYFTEGSFHSSFKESVLQLNVL